MSHIELDDWEYGIRRIATQVREGVVKTATEVQRVAILRAPVRKAFTSKHRATKVDLDAFMMKVGKGTYSGAELREAASLLQPGPNGINLAESAAKAKGGRLLVQTGRSGGANSLLWRRKRTTGAMLRRVIPQYRTSGNPVGFKPNPRLKQFGVGLTPRARYDIKRGRGVIQLANGRYQYGGFLRSQIVVEEDQGEGLRILVKVRSKAPYSRYVEFPTSRTAAQPYLLPALKGVRSKYAGNLRRR